MINTDVLHTHPCHKRDLSRINYQDLNEPLETAA